MTDTFTWRANVGSTGEGNAVVSTSQFGDGYAQEVSRGLNSEVQAWQVTYAGYKSQVQPVVDFLRAHIGQSFFWKPPLGVVGYYKCKRWNINPEGGDYYTLSMQFEHGYAP